MVLVHIWYPEQPWLGREVVHRQTHAHTTHSTCALYIEVSAYDLNRFNCQGGVHKEVSVTLIDNVNTRPSLP